MELKRCMIFSGTFRCYNEELFKDLVIGDEKIDMVCSLNKFDGTYPPYLTYFKTYELPDHWHFVNRLDNWSNYNTCSMYYHNNLAFKYASRLKPDIVIKMRSDIIPRSKFPHFIPAKNTVYHPNVEIYSGMNDQIAVGDFETMKIYCDLYNNLEQYVKGNECRFHAETLLLHHLRKHGVQVEKFNFNYSLAPNRRNN